MNVSNHVLFSIETDFEILELLPYTAGNLTRPVKKIVWFSYSWTQNVLDSASALKWKCIFSGSLSYLALLGRVHWGPNRTAPILNR